MNKRGLGRGLEALIPDTTALAEDDLDHIRSLPIDAIEPNPHQPRREFSREELDALADSIRDQGLLQPILVRRTEDDRFQLIAGERRWRAAARVGFERIPAIVRDATDEELLPLALVENLLREQLNPLEEANAYRDLGEEAGWTQERIAERVGKSRAHVANTLRLLKLPAEFQADVASGALSAGHARALLACDSDLAMRALRDAIVAQGLSVREAEERAGATSESPAAAPDREGPRKRTRARRRTREVSPEVRDLEERLQRIYGTPVQVHERGGRGRVSLEFYSWDDLNRLTDLLFAASEHGPNR